MELTESTAKQELPACPVETTLTLISDKWKVLTALWSVVLLLPILGLFLLYKLQILAPYQIMRLKTFATGGGEAGYVTAALRESYQSLTWIGAMDQQAGAKLPDLNADYIFTYLWSEYGILAGILLCCLLGILLVLVFGAALHQKNELGFMMGTPSTSSAAITPTPSPSTANIV